MKIYILYDLDFIVDKSHVSESISKICLHKEYILTQIDYSLRKEVCPILYINTGIVYYNLYIICE